MERLQSHVLELPASGIGISLYKETTVARSICTGDRLKDYSVSNSINTEKYCTVQTIYLYISSDPLRRANTRSDVSSSFHFHWIALGQISPAVGNTSGHYEVPRQGWSPLFPSPEWHPCRVSCSRCYIHELIWELVDTFEASLKRIVKRKLYAPSYNKWP